MPRRRFNSAATRAKAMGYRSGIEHLLRNWLKARDIPHKYEDRECRIPWVQPAINHQYLSDFFFIKRDGDMMLVDTKGRWTLEDRKMHLYIFQQHPGLDVRFLFQNNPEKTKVTSRVTVAQLCTKGQGYVSKGIDWRPFHRPFAWCPIRQRNKKPVLLPDAFPAEWLEEIDIDATEHYMLTGLHHGLPISCL